MREIKFRAWDKEYEEMLHDVSLDSDTWDMMNEFFKHIDLEWLQYTGLKDKNGVEIYEGDILSNIEFSDEVYDSGRGTWDCGSYLLGDCNECSEIIGNKYENPELLK